MFTNIPLTVDQVYDRFNGTYQYNFSDIGLSFQYAPAYTWPEVIYEEQNTAPAYHYHDCTCKQCRAIHFPCDDMACDYCNSVRHLMYSNPQIQISTTPLYGAIVDYNTYMELPDVEYDYHELKYDYCKGCDDLYCGVTLAQHDGYHSEECKEAYEITEDPIYCRVCQDQTVTSDGDLCDYCENNQEHGYEISEDEIEYWNEFWVAPSGDIYCVSEDYGHDHAARYMGYNNADHAESNGYIHISNGYNKIHFVYVPHDYTDVQVNACMIICEAKEVEYPEFIQEWMDANVQTSMEVIDYKPMQNLAPSWLRMTRSERDRFYPLSGD